MARGFESKSVADQQESAQNRQRTAKGNTGEPASAIKLRKLELARADVVRQLGLAHADAHKEMLRRALAALDKDIAAF